MKIITAEGKIVEGQQLTEEELNIFEELTTNTDTFEGVYSKSTRQAIAARIFATYHITRRNPIPPAKAPEPYDFTL